MKKITLISYHLFNSERKAGFHWLANAFAELGWEVVFLTSAISYFSYLKKDFRLKYINKFEFNKFIQRGNNIKSYANFTIWHPVNFNSKLLNKIFSPLFDKFDKTGFAENLNNELSSTDVFIFESFSGLFHLQQIKNLNPDAKYIYRVSDDMQLINLHPSIINFEKKIYKSFDLISVPVEMMKSLFPESKNVKTHPHGIAKELFDKEHKNPYDNYFAKNFVFTGISLLDNDFLEIASEKFPEYGFHIIGPFQKIINSGNVKYYGEMPFENTIPFIKYADAGLLIRKETDKVETLSESLKSVQYTYCRLPIISPHYLKTDRNNYFYYDLKNPETIQTAINSVVVFERNKIDTSKILSWKEIANELIK